MGRTNNLLGGATMSTISAGTTSNTALRQTGDTTGALVFQTNGTTTAVTISTAQIVSLTSSLALLGSASGSVALAAPATAGTQSYTLPTAVPAANGYPLTSTTAGVMSWAATSGTGLSVLNNTPSLTNPTVTNYTESVVAIGTVTTTNTIALTSGTVQTATLTASTACTFTMPTATAGKSFILLLKQAAATGNGTATFTGVKWGTAGAPTITATAGKMDILSFVADGTNWYGSITQGYTP
jgi:hypothetical protein